MLLAVLVYQDSRVYVPIAMSWTNGGRRVVVKSEGTI